MGPEVHAPEGDVIRQCLKFNVDEVADLQGNVPEKLICVLGLNYDETSVCLLLLGTRGWKDKQEQAMATTHGKLQCIFLKGTAPRSLPSAWPDNMLCACTETRWQTVESMLEFVWYVSECPRVNKYRVHKKRRK